MAKHVMIFGAGASACTGTPLLANFIDAAEDLHEERRSYSDHPASEFEFLFNLLRTRLRLLYAKSAVRLQNIEQVFSLIEMGQLLRMLPETSEEDIARAARAIRVVLATTVERRCHLPHSRENGVSAPEPYRTVTRLAADPHSTNAVIPGKMAYITFNYDLALEVALVRAGLPFDYGLERASGGVPVLKLHGSLNWSTCTNPECRKILPIDIAWLLRELTNRLARAGERTTQRVLLVATPFLPKVEPHCRDAVPAAEPAIVPPSWNKTQYHERFQAIWQRAAKELSEASEITVVGYSLPDADAFFKDLLALGLSGPTRIRRFTVVDPSADVATRFRSLLGPEAQDRFTHVAKTFEDYARHDIPGGTRFRVSSLG